VANASPDRRAFTTSSGVKEDRSAVVGASNPGCGMSARGAAPPAADCSFWRARRAMAGPDASATLKDGAPEQELARLPQQAQA